MSIRSTIHTRFFAAVPGDFLVYLRLVFSAVMLSYVVMYTGNGWVQSYYIAPEYLFKWPAFSWVHAWPGNGMLWHFGAMAGLCGLMLVGLLYRAAALLFAVCFTYVFLLDKAQYQNHYYLIMLMSWLMAIVPANHAWSLDALLWPSIRSTTAPAWTLWLLRFQIGVPYFFGGVAKISSDWLHGQPMRESLADRTWYPVIGPSFTDEWVVQSFVWGGLLLDLLLVPLLLNRRTRVIAFCGSLVFHLLNATLFHIGVFPWFMIFATVVFCEPDWPRRLFRRRGRFRTPKTCPQGSTTLVSRRQLSWSQGCLLSGIVVYVVVQLLLPFRHHLYPGDVNWTEEGHYFAWHMKLRGKRCALRYEYRDRDTGEAGAVDIRKHLSPKQASVFMREPRMIVAFAHHLAEEFRRAGHGNREIRVINLVSLNGRKPQLLIDPDVDLTRVEVGGSQLREITVPLTEPLRYDAWAVPTNEWEHRLVGTEHPSNDKHPTDNRRQHPRPQRLATLSPP